MSASTAALLRLLVVAICIAVLWHYGDRAVTAIQAPVRAELNAARGNNVALKASTDEQNKAVDQLKSDSGQRQAKSAAAVSAAGKDHAARAVAIAGAPPQGASDYERAVNRVDRELGLK